MAPICSVCKSPHREAIEAEILRGQPFLTISSTYGVHRHSVKHHKSVCLRRIVRKAEIATGIKMADKLDEFAEDLRRKSLELHERALENGDIKGANGAVANASRNVRLAGELNGRIGTRINVLQVFGIDEDQLKQAAESYKSIKDMSEDAAAFEAAEGLALYAKANPQHLVKLLSIISGREACESPNGHVELGSQSGSSAVLVSSE